MSWLANFINSVLGKNPPPNLPNTRLAENEYIPASARRRGLVKLGEPSSGKSASAANMTVDHLIEHPEESLISFDGSEDFTNKFIKIVLSKPKPIRDALTKRIIYDELGHPKYTHTNPPFHTEYKMSLERRSNTE